MGDLPTPEGWNNRTWQFWSVFALTGAGGLYCATKTVLAATKTHWISAAISASAAAVLLIAAAAALTALRPNQLQASVDNHGTELTVQWARIRWLAVWFAAVIVGLVLFLLYGAHLSRWAADFRIRSIGWLTIALTAAVAGLALAIRASRREPPRLRLSTEGIDHRDAAGQFTLAWDEITNITGLAPSNKAIRPIVFHHNTTAPSVITGTSAYAPDGAALFWLIRHYWLHPEARTELTNGTAIERLTSKNLTPE